MVSRFKQNSARLGEQTRKVLAILGPHVARAFTWNLQSVALRPGEAEKLAASGITDAVMQRYYAWRRSLLWCVIGPLALTALLNTIDSFSLEGFTPFGHVLWWLRNASLWAMPVMAVLALMVWATPKCRRWLFLGWLIGFAVPIFIALMPADAVIGIEVPSAAALREQGATPEAAQQAVMAAQLQAGGLAAVIYTLLLLPLLLSLLPAAVRAALRVKTLCPGSILTGWTLVGAAVLNFAMWLVPLVFINALSGATLLTVALTAFLAGPLWWVWNSRQVTALTGAAQIPALGRIQSFSVATSLLGIAILIQYGFTHDLFGRRVLGFTDAALLRPWTGDIYRFVFEYIARSLLITAVFADFITRINLRAHADQTAFAQSPAQAEHEAMMKTLQSDLGKA